MRKASLIPSAVLGLCLGLCGCGGTPEERAQAEIRAEQNLADIEERFQTSAEIAEHCAEARKAAREFLEKNFFVENKRCQGGQCKIYGLHSSLSEGGTYRIAADVGIGEKREIVKLEAIRFFAEGGGLESYWQVVLLSATSERVIGDPVNIQRLRNPDAPTTTLRAEPPAPAAAPPGVELTPAASPTP